MRPKKAWNKKGDMGLGVIIVFIIFWVVVVILLCYCADGDLRELKSYTEEYHECPECHWNGTGANANITQIAGSDEFTVTYFYCPECGYLMKEITVND